MNPAMLNNADLDAFDAVRDSHGAGFPFQTIDEIAVGKVAPKIWIIKGIVARGETSAWIAPPGGMKSALMAELSICSAWGDDWHGHKSKRIENVVYFALERADLVRRRIRAHIGRWSHQAGCDPVDLPNITVVASTIDLVDVRNVQKVIATIRNIESVAGTAGLIIFDTFAKLIAAGGGDEDKAKDQGKVFANVQRIKDALNRGSIGAPHVALVGHTGKDETRGSRGSNAIVGDVDLMVTISGDAIKTATVVKANDAPEGPLFSFKSEVFEFGTDEDGDPITVNIVSSDDVSAQSEAKPRINRRLSDPQKLALAALSETILSVGKPVPSAFDISANGVTLDQWKDELYSRGVLSADDANPRSTFKRLQDSLTSRQRIGRKDGIVWLAA